MRPRSQKAKGVSCDELVWFAAKISYRMHTLTMKKFETIHYLQTILSAVTKPQCSRRSATTTRAGNVFELTSRKLQVKELPNC